MATQIILITGCSVGGIGFELAAKLLAQSHTVLLGTRSEQARTQASQELESRSLPGRYDLVELDVNSEDSINAAASHVESVHRRLDALVNNAAVGTKVTGTLTEQYAQSFQTNATGPFLMGEAFVSLLKKSTSTPRIINISSGAGSIRRLLDRNSPRFHLHRAMGMNHLAYGASKAAMNLITAKQAVIYGEDGVKVFAYSPGFVISNLGPTNKAENGAQSTDEAVVPILAVLEGKRDEEHGCFLSADGQYEW